MEENPNIDESVERLVSTIKAYAAMRAYKDISEYCKKYKQKLQRELNDTQRKLSRMEKYGVKNQKYGMLEMESHILKFQTTKAESLEIEFTKDALDIANSEALSTEEFQKLIQQLAQM
jgi:hypothetical protein